MEDTPVTMIRESLENLPSFRLPEGYHIRNFRRGEEPLWAEVECAAGEFTSQEAGLARFNEEFGEHLDEMEDRCFFLVEDSSGRVIGTASAWYNREFRGEDYGRVHWVSIHPEFQGRGLAKPLMCAVMDRLARSHSKAYLTTQTRSARAIGIYLDFGFSPLLVSDTCKEAWRYLANVLKHPTLAGFAQ